MTAQSSTSSHHTAASQQRQQDDTLFQAILIKVGKARDLEQLKTAVSTALRLLMRREDDQVVREKVYRETMTIIERLCTAQDAPALDAQILRSALLCEEILKLVKERRDAYELAALEAIEPSPLEELKPPPPKFNVVPHVPPASRQEHPHAAPHNAQPHRPLGWAWAVAGTVALGAATLVIGWVDGDSNESDGVTLASEVMEAARGSGELVNIFSQPIRLERRDNHLTVVTEGVPPRECGTAAWVLAKTGVVAVNGTTPARPSASNLKNLCFQNDDGATIAWTPRSTK